MVTFKVTCKDSENHELTMDICPEKGTFDVNSADFTTNINSGTIKRVLDMLEKFQLLMTETGLKSIDIERE